MARIELRDCIVRFKDGFGGTAAVNDPDGLLADEEVTIEIDTVANLTNNTSLVPVGARFTVAGVDDIYTVTAQDANEKQSVTIDADDGTFTLTYKSQETGNLDHDVSLADMKTALELLSSITTVNVYGTPGTLYIIELVNPDGDGTLLVSDNALLIKDAGGGGSGTATVALVAAVDTVTCQLTFTPALSTEAGIPSDDDVVTFLPQQIEIKVGDGNITYTEHRNYEYMLDRGDLDTVREGDEVPLDVKLECTYEHITTGTSETISPMDALKGVGEASGWVSSAADQCEPYAIDIEVEHVPPCGTSQKEITLFPDFRADTKEVNFKDANISLTGKCNVIEPIVTREDA